MFRQWMQYKAPNFHSRMRNYHGINTVLASAPKDEIDVHAAIFVGRGGWISDPSQAFFHLQRPCHQRFQWPLPMRLKHLVEEIGSLEAPGRGLPNRTGADDLDSFVQDLLGFGQGLGGIPRIAPEHEKDPMHLPGRMYLGYLVFHLNANLR